MASAIGHIFGVLELLAGLRAEYPAGADYAITHWRSMLLQLAGARERQRA